MRAKPKKWTEEELSQLSEFYPLHGVKWCAAHFGLNDGQIRTRASMMQLKARGVSAAWVAKQARHSEILTGRKRPAQAVVMRQLHAAGKLALDPESRARSVAGTKAWLAANGHPRGALGMKHTAETRATLGEKSAAAWARMTEDQILDRTKKMMETREANGTVSPPRPGASWKAGWREIGGVRKYYRSRWEANYALYLEWLKETQNGVAAWAHEPKVFWFEGIKRGCVSYLPDFWVQAPDGSEAYHEVKGWMDDRSKTKIRRMAKYHPTVVLVVVDAKAYRKLAKQVAGFIPGWES